MRFPRPDCPLASRVVGDCQNEKPIAPDRCARLSRAEQSALQRKTKSLKVSPNSLGAPFVNHAGHVLDKDEPDSRLDDDPPRGRPQIALIVLAPSFASSAPRLARDAANEAIHKAAPWAAVEGSGIAPHRARSHETLLHRCDQMRDGEGFPLHHADRSSTWHCQFDAEIETAAAGAEGEDVDGGR